jgi:isopenicillin N synthase-like dioxygenase
MPSKALPKASLPIFDFSAFRKGDAEEKHSAANQIVDAFKKYGFVYLVNHGISPEQNQALFDWVGFSRVLATPAYFLLLDR